jgi:hypothetical protein
MTRRNEELAAVLRELKARGIEYEVRYGGKHCRVLWEVRTHKRMTIVGVSASDWRAAKNARAFVRRQLREEGIG